MFPSRSSYRIYHLDNLRRAPCSPLSAAIAFTWPSAQLGLLSLAVDCHHDRPSFLRNEGVYEQVNDLLVPFCAGSY